MRLDPAYEAAIRRQMAECGIDQYRIEMGGKHPRLEFLYQGHWRKLAFPGSPSDARRGVKNFTCDLKRALGLAAPPKTVEPAPEELPAPALLKAVRQRLTVLPPTRPTDRDRKALALLDRGFRSAVAIGRDAGASTPDVWAVERLERLVVLGLADADGWGRYRRR